MMEHLESSYTGKVSLHAYLQSDSYYLVSEIPVQHCTVGTNQVIDLQENRNLKWQCRYIDSVSSVQFGLLPRDVQPILGSP